MEVAYSHYLEFLRPGERRASENAGRFLGQALTAGGIAVAVATPGNAKVLAAHVSRPDRFTLFESCEMLSRFCMRSAIDFDRFDRSVGAVMRDAMDRANGAPVHAFGDMVGILWQRDERDLAVELEHAWCVLQERLGFSLYCAYPIDVFGGDFCGDVLDGLLATHSHLMGGPTSAEMGRALDRALNDVLGPDASRVRNLTAQHRAPDWATMPKLENLILWLRSNLPQHADAVFARAREYYDGAAPRVYLRQQHSSS